MSIENKNELAEYCIGRQLIGNYSFYPEGIAQKILNKFNFDKFNRPSRPTVDHAGLLVLSDAIVYLAEQGDSGRIYKGSGDIKEAFKNQKELVDIYYQYADSILCDAGPDYYSAYKHISQFQVVFNQFEKNGSVHIMDAEIYARNLEHIKKEVTKYYVQDQVSLLLELGKGYISDETMKELEKLKTDDCDDRTKVTGVLDQVKFDLKQNSAPSFIFDLIYNILKFFNIEKSSIFNGFFNQNITRDLTNQLSEVFQDDSSQMDMSVL